MYWIFIERIRIKIELLQINQVVILHDIFVYVEVQKTINNIGSVHHYFKDF